MAGWWAGDKAGAIDVTSEKATLWWRQRLEELRTMYQVDAFKFDAGEVNWIPHSSSLGGNQDLAPNSYTTKYVEGM